jgi:hypothetical protein
MRYIRRLERYTICRGLTKCYFFSALCLVVNDITNIRRMYKLYLDSSREILVGKCMDENLFKIIEKETKKHMYEDIKNMLRNHYEVILGELKNLNN